MCKMVQDSIGGNSLTYIVLNCSEASYNIDESISTLRFGERAKFIRNRPTINQGLSVPELKSRLDA
eukprot:gene5632-15725_t